MPRAHSVTARRPRLLVEELEGRDVPSTSDLLVSPALDLASAARSGLPEGFSPAQIRHAYGFDQVFFAAPHGRRLIPGDGRGQTIAIVNAYHSPTIHNDLDVFNRTFGLPAPPQFTQVMLDALGNPTATPPPTDPGWALETALDVQWAHAIAPKANLLLVEAHSAYIDDMLRAVDYARRQPGVVAVSMSWGQTETLVAFSYPEQYYDNSLDAVFTTPPGHAGVTFVAASGDYGAIDAPLWPAISENVLAVGGTALYTSDAQGTYAGEWGWEGSGGGVSLWTAEPSYQRSAQGTGNRTNPDVAYNADPNTGFAVYSSFGYEGQSGWFVVGGTSAGAPQWAALLAVVAQGRELAGRPSLAGAQANVYALPAEAFHDILLGANGYPAGPGYDLVTGLGTPVVPVLVAELVRAEQLPFTSSEMPSLPPLTLRVVPLADAQTGSAAPLPQAPGAVRAATGLNSLGPIALPSAVSRPRAELPPFPAGMQVSQPGGRDLVAPALSSAPAGWLPSSAEARLPDVFGSGESRASAWAAARSPARAVPADRGEESWRATARAVWWQQAVTAYFSGVGAEVSPSARTDGVEWFERAEGPAGLAVLAAALAGTWTAQDRPGNRRQPF